MIKICCICDRVIENEEIPVYYYIDTRGEIGFYCKECDEYLESLDK